MGRHRSIVEGPLVVVVSMVVAPLELATVVAMEVVRVAEVRAEVMEAPVVWDAMAVAREEATGQSLKVGELLFCRVVD